MLVIPSYYFIESLEFLCSVRGLSYRIKRVIYEQYYMKNMPKYCSKITYVIFLKSKRIYRMRGTVTVIRLTEI